MYLIKAVAMASLTLLKVSNFEQKNHQNDDKIPRILYKCFYLFVSERNRISSLLKAFVSKWSCLLKLVNKQHGILEIRLKTQRTELC